MIGHTQLPWHVEDDRVVFGSGFLVAECYGGTTKESIANAAFIVKAVNNHEALVKALTELCDEIACEEQHGDGADDPDCQTCRAHKRARKLLAGVVGGSGT